MVKKSKKRNRGFLWGLILGIIIAAGAIWYYNNHYKKSDLEKEAKKIEKKAKKEIEKAEDKAKKIFE
ncbi:MAG: hypothetical protein JW798_15015 [Prolixibacteraceae bacterium]|nr:hypothetical protein [Prolixibacteraceae bacterium]